MPLASILYYPLNKNCLLCTYLAYEQAVQLLSSQVHKVVASQFTPFVSLLSTENIGEFGSILKSYHN